MNEPARDSLSAYLERRVREGWLPGAVWYVGSSGDRLSGGACGDAALERPYDLASLTKPLATALLLVMFEQDSRIDLEAPADAYLEELRGTPSGAASLLDLAAHRAGLPAWLPIYLDASTPEAYLEKIAAHPDRRPSGETLYSDLGYIMLGILLERVGGARLAELFDRRIATPLGLVDCGFAVAPTTFRHAAPTERGNDYERRLAGEAGVGYDWRREIPPGVVHDANAHRLGGSAGHAGLFGTLADVVRIAGELLDGDRLGLTERARVRLLVEAAPGSGRTVGLVLGAHSRATRGILPAAAVGHTGFTGTSLWLDPRRRRLMVLLSNRVHPRVPDRDFQLLRRGFHRLAVGLDG